MLGCSSCSLNNFDVIGGAPQTKEVIRRVRAFLPENPVILEAGTYDAKDTLELGELMPMSQIFTFEPIPNFFNYASRRIECFSNIKIYNYALSDKSGMESMYLSEKKNNPGVVSESSSLLAPKEHLIYSSATVFLGNIEVKTITMDDWSEKYNIPVIDFIKLDVQGVELNILRSSPNVLSNVKAILTEVEFVEAYEGQYLFKDVKIWLEKEGFELDVLFNQGWFGDALFIRKNHRWD